MKELLLFVFLGIIGAFGVGFITGQALQTPTAEQCLNVCVDAFERMSC